MRKLILVPFLALAALANAADAQLLTLLAPEAKILGGVQADRVKASQFGQYLLQNLTADDANFQRFIQETGFDPRYDVSEILFATLPSKGADRGIVAVRGNFQPGRLAETARKYGSVATQYKGVELFTGQKGSEAMAVLDQRTAVFGHTDWVKAAIDRRGTQTTLSPALVTQMQQLSAAHDMWFYSNYKIEVEEDEKQQMPIRLESIEQLWGGLKFADVVTLKVDALARSAEDAQSLVDVVKFGLVLIRGNAKEMPAQVKTMLDSAQLTAAGTKASLTMSIPERQLEQLFQMVNPQKRSDPKKAPAAVRVPKTERARVVAR